MQGRVRRGRAGLNRAGHRAGHRAGLGRLSGLLASSSVAAVLVGGGAPAAFAACNTSYVNTTTGGCSNTATIIGITINNSTINGTISNSGTISPNGIALSNGSTIVGSSGGIADSGTIGGGISIDRTSAVTSYTRTAISISDSAFSGGIGNAGKIMSTFGNAIFVDNTATFAGGISNSGTISAPATGFGNSRGNGIWVGGSASRTTLTIFTFTGGISNSGTISAGANGIWVGGIALIPGGTHSTASLTVATFAGGISNSGTISAAGGAGIWAGGVASIGQSLANVVLVTISTFSGGISNSGTILAGGNGIWVGGSSGLHGFALTSSAAQTIATFSGGISNSGMISAGGAGILVGGDASVAGVAGGGDNSTYTVALSTFADGISNSGTITAGGAGIWVGGDAILSSDTHNVATVTVATFGGGISNSGTITAGGNGIWVGGTASLSNSGSRNTASVTISTFSGGISNSGTILATGAGIMVGGAADDSVNGNGNTASVTIVTFSGGISNSGTISAGGAGIEVGGSANANTRNTASVTISTFAGGISNSGTISSTGADGILVDRVLTFAGNISNSGTVSGADAGLIVFSDTSFAGAINNSGTISSPRYGLIVSNVSQFGSSNGGGITNSGTISATDFVGVLVVSDTIFSGGISNSGKISAGGTGVEVQAVSTFTGGVSNSGTISAGVRGIYVRGGVSTFAGGISNSGTIVARTGIVVTGVSTFLGAIANSGTITGTGGTAIDVSAAPGNMTIDITGGAITGNILGAGTTSGDTVNFALGSGSFAYANTITGMQSVNINSGTLFDSRAITAAGVVVNSGGTLAPGLPGTTGTLSIAGNLSFNSGSGYEIQLTPTQHAFATVTGAVAIGGGTVELSPSGTLGTHYSATTFAILTSSGSLAGTFNPAVTYANAARLSSTPTLSYDAHDAYLSYGNSYVDLAIPAGANQNQQNVINGINTAIVAGDAVPNGFNQLLGLSGAAYLNALSRLDGEAATDAGKGANQLMTDFLNLMLDPTAGGGSAASGGGATGFAPEQDASLPPDVALAYAKALRAPQPQSPQSFDQRWSAWGSAFGGTSWTKGDPIVGSNNVSASDYGFAAGMEYRATPNTVYGFGLAGGGTNWNLAQGLGSGRSDSFQAGVYAKTHWGPLYLSGALAFANHWFTTDRIAMSDQLQANFTGQSYAARLESGYRYAVPITGAIVGVTPYAALQAQDFHTPSYSETDLSGGGFGLSYAAMNATDTRSELGARFDNLQVMDGMPLVLRGRLAWAHDWVTDPALGAVFQTLPGSSFTVNGAAPPKNSALTTAAAELHITANWTAIAKFDGDFGDGAQTYGGTGTLRYTW